MHTTTIDKLRPGHEYPGGNINSRREYTRAEIDSRKESILAFGILQSLLVCPAPGKTEGPFFVGAGGLREIAVRELVAEKRLATNYEIPIIVKSDWDAATTLSASIEENRSPVPPHPVEVYEQFAELADRGKTVADLMRLYGMKEKQVLGVLALGRLHPDIRKAWLEGHLKAEIAEVFTLESDQKRQAAVYKKLIKHGRMWEDTVRREIIGEHNSSGHLINYIGVQAYEAAGGKVMVDLFKSRHGVSDPALAKRLADEKLQGELERLRADGWAWAELADDLSSDWRWSWGKLNGKPELTDEESKRLAEIGARLKQIQGMDWDDDEGDEIDEDGNCEEERLYIEKEQIEGAARARSFTEKQKAKAGVVVQLTGAGKLEFHWGVIKPNQAKDVANKDLDAKGRAAKKKATKKATTGLISNAIAQRMSETLTYATGDVVADAKPEIVLALALAGFATYEKPICLSESGLARKRTERSHDFDDDGDDGYLKAFNRFKKLPIKDLQVRFARVVGNAVDFQILRAEEKPFEDRPDVLAICESLDGKKLNASIRKTFDAADYFKSVSAKVRLAAIEEAMGADHARGAAKLKGPEQQVFCVENLPKTGWLPPELRTAHYDGPVAKKAPAKPKARKPAKKAPAKTKRKAA